MIWPESSRKLVFESGTEHISSALITICPLSVERPLLSWVSLFHLIPFLTSIVWLLLDQLVNFTFPSTNFGLFHYSTCPVGCCFFRKSDFCCCFNLCHMQEAGMEVLTEWTGPVTFGASRTSQWENKGIKRSCYHNTFLSEELNHFFINLSWVFLLNLECNWIWMVAMSETGGRGRQSALECVWEMDGKVEKKQPEI